MARSLTRPLIISTTIALSITLLLYVFSQTSIAKRLEQVSYDYRLSLSRANTDLPNQVMVILIDDASLKQMDRVVGRWPWPRSIYHELINYISTGQPKAIVFDLLFSEQELSAKTDSHEVASSKSNDDLLIQATASQPHIHHAMQLVPAGNASLADSASIDPVVKQQHGLNEKLLKSLDYLRDARQNISQYDDAIIPIPGLVASSSQIGVVTASTDNDGIYRRTQLFFRQGDSIFPALSIAPLIADERYRKTILKYHYSIYTLQDTDTEITVPINFYADYRPLSIGYLLESISNLYAGNMDKIRIPPSEFKNKYVYIGASAIGLHDLKPTSISKLAPGVYIHAAMLANIITKDLLIPSSKLATIAITFLSAFLTALAVILIKQLTIQTTIPFIFGLSYYIVCQAMIENNRILNFTLPALSITSSWIFAYLFLFATEKKEKRNIRNMFSRYVSPAALSCMENEFKNYKTLGKGSEEIVTVLFSDIRGFTSLSEQLDAREIVTLLNHHFSIMTDVIFKHHGTVDKFIGDAIMATWGAPIPSQYHVKNAVAAAIEMHYAMHSVNDWLVLRKLGKIKMGIGVHTGAAIIGSIGSTQKADYTVIGDTVNLCSRLEGLSKLYRTPIIISGASYTEIRKDTPCQMLDRVKVKGKTQAIDIYRPILFGKSLSISTRHDAELLQQRSLLAFQHYRSRQWAKALNLLESFPVAYRNHPLSEKCKQNLDSPPNDNWDCIREIVSK